MLATKGDHVPTGAEWVHEVKWDGMRVLVDVRDGRAADLVAQRERRHRLLPRAARAWPTSRDDLLLDGEVVALGEGIPTFGALQDRMHVRDAARALRLAERNPVTLIAFDLLRLDGEDLCDRPLCASGASCCSASGSTTSPGRCPRRTTTGRCCSTRPSSRVSRASSASGSPRATGPGVRSRDWLKFPIRPTGSFVVGGYRHEIGSRPTGSAPCSSGSRPRPASPSAAGSAAASRARPVACSPTCSPHASWTRSPFDAELPRLDREGTVWVEPFLVVDVQYLRLTNDGRLRQPAYRGVRTDLTPADLD